MSNLAEISSVQLRAMCWELLRTPLSKDEMIVFNELNDELINRKKKGVYYETN